MPCANGGNSDEIPAGVDLSAFQPSPPTGVPIPSRVSIAGVSKHVHGTDGDASSEYFLHDSG